VRNNLPTLSHRAPRVLETPSILSNVLPLLILIIIIPSILLPKPILQFLLYHNHSQLCPKLPTLLLVLYVLVNLDLAVLLLTITFVLMSLLLSVSSHGARLLALVIKHI
jgi:hypothetical protein